MFGKTRPMCPSNLDAVHDFVLIHNVQSPDSRPFLSLGQGKKYISAKHPSMFGRKNNFFVPFFGYLGRTTNPRLVLRWPEAEAEVPNAVVITIHTTYL